MKRFHNSVTTSLARLQVSCRGRCMVNLHLIEALTFSQLTNKILMESLHGKIKKILGASLTSGPCMIKANDTLC